MGEAHGHHHHHQQQLLLHQQQRTQTHSRLGGLRGAGEIVEVQGGHIVRSTGRKDRHSKVCTAKGPRDRRVRLSAPTAIQFYDVQDRLGYDRPSKAVDWLMKNAKAAIDKLAELPAWNPTAERSVPRPSDPQDDLGPTRADANQPIDDPGKKMIPVAAPAGSAAFGFGGGSGSSGSFLPPSLDSDAIADTIKSFFPMAATTPSSSPPLGYQNYQPELLSRSNSQDLRLSLQSFQDFHHPHSTHHHQTPTASPHQALFAGSAPLAFDATPASWPEQNQRMFAWNVVDTGGGGGGGGGGGYMFNVPPPQAVPLHPVLGHSQFFTQRGPLQSSNSPSVRAWADPMSSASDHQMQPALHPSVSSIGFASGGSFSGFRIPARIQGEEEHDGISDKPSSAPHH